MRECWGPRHLQGPAWVSTPCVYPSTLSLLCSHTHLPPGFLLVKEVPAVPFFFLQPCSSPFLRFTPSPHPQLLLSIALGVPIQTS